MSNPYLFSWEPFNHFVANCKDQLYESLVLSDEPKVILRLSRESGWVRGTYYLTIYINSERVMSVKFILNEDDGSLVKTYGTQYISWNEGFGTKVSEESFWNYISFLGKRFPELVQFFIWNQF